MPKDKEFTTQRNEGEGPLRESITKGSRGLFDRVRSTRRRVKPNETFATAKFAAN
jgi:hypothetical protein